MVALLPIGGACSIADRFEARLDAMNRSVTTARDDMVLLNVVRARHSHPLTFVSVTSLSGSQGGGANLGLPTLTFGPAQVNAQRQFAFASNAVSGSFNGNITVAPLESREFYQGLLQPIPLSALQFLLAQGYPRQILFPLLVESVRLKSARGERLLYNNPTDPTFPLFADHLGRLIAAGLTVEAAGAGAAACFDRAAATRPLNGAGPACGGPGSRSGLTGLVEPGLGPVAVSVVLRSTNGVFRYLGRLTDPRIGPLVTLSGDQVGNVLLGPDKRLFPVTADEGDACLARVSYLGETVCLPAFGAEQGTVVLQLLTQLLALNVSVRDLPALPTIRLAN